jgi:23S rRNA pseudouridine1911/1915/1917 synthase
VTKEEMTFTAPLPTDMEKILTGLRNKRSKSQQ